MESNKLMYSPGKNDELYTLAYAVEPILKFIPKGAIVWAPFDTVNSEFVKQIRKKNKVVFSHIKNGQDFFNYEPEKWDVIISNPPFTNKRKYFERALSFGKPFALIMSNTWLNDSAPKQLFKDKELQLLMFENRMEFSTPGGVIDKKITFSSSYFCYNFLPKQIIMEKLKKTSKKDYCKLRETKWGLYLFIGKTPQKIKFNNHGKILNKLSKDQLVFVKTYLESI